MRIRAVVAFGLLLVPVVLSAQRIPFPGAGRGRGPTRPVPLSPQPPAIARDLAYKRMRFSVESYPFFSVARADGFIANGIVSSWRSFGTGTRASYRLAPYLSATLDMTAAFMGGPAMVETAELGTRLGPERWDSRVHPFLDLRVGYMHAYDTYIRPIDDAFVFPEQPGMGGARYSHGAGGVAGAGMQYSLTHTLSLTTAVSVMRNRMTAYRFTGAVPGSDGSYWLTSYRYMVGLRYNPVRMMQMPATVTR